MVVTVAARTAAVSVILICAVLIDCGVMQVTAKCRQATDIVKSIIEIYAEKPDVYKQVTGKRRAIELWSEGGLGGLQPLI